MPYSEELIEEVIKGQDSFVWEAPAWEHRDRNPRWYLIMSLVAVGLVTYAVASGNFLFAFLVLLAAIILVLAGNDEPRTALVQIGKNGIVMEGKLYEYKDLSNFSIIYQPPDTKVLYVETGSYFRPRLRIPLQAQNPIELRAHLKQYLNENLVLQEEHLSDILARLLKI